MYNPRYGIIVYFIFCLLPTIFFLSCDSDFKRQGADFIPLGRLPGHIFSQGFGVSADGVVAVGASFAPPPQDIPEAFRWTAKTGMVGLGNLSNTIGSFAQASNSDGSVIAGSGTIFDIKLAFRWTEATGMEHLNPVNSELPAAIATGISADGSVIVGGAKGGFMPEAYRWTADGGLVGLGTLSGSGGSSCAEGVSADGNIITGASTKGSEQILTFRWTKESGMVGLPLLDEALASEGFDISPDGNIIVGTTTFSDQGIISVEATIWNNDEVMGLGKIPGFPDSSAQAVSKDGSIVIGNSSGSSETAFIWDEQNGMRSLIDVLVNEGLEEELQGWVLIKAEGISDDGRVIVGTGINPIGLDEAFIAILP